MQLKNVLSRFAVSFIFISFGLWEIINPLSWISFVPDFLSRLSFVSTLITIHGIVLIVLGAWFLWGKKIRIAAVLSSLVMLDIIIGLIISSGWSDLLIRDIGIFIFILSFVFEKENN